MATTTFDHARPPSEMATKAQSLLRRYPKLSEQELATLIDIFPRLEILEVGLMVVDDGLAERLAAFRSDHGAKFELPTTVLLAGISLAAIIVLAVLLWSVAY